MRIDAGSITFGSAFLYGYLASLSVFLPLLTLLGLSSLFGGPGVNSGGQPVHGIAGLFVAWVVAFIFPLFGALILSLGTVFLRVIRRAPTLSVGPVVD